jgi:hypothetical protein
MTIGEPQVNSRFWKVAQWGERAPPCVRKMPSLSYAAVAPKPATSLLVSPYRPPTECSFPVLRTLPPSIDRCQAFCSEQIVQRLARQNHPRLSRTTATSTQDCASRNCSMSQFRAKRLDLGGFINIKIIRDHTKRKVFEKFEAERCTSPALRLPRSETIIRCPELSDERLTVCI